MEKETTLDEYFLFKMALAILYYPKEDIQSDIPWLYDINTLKILNTITKLYAERCRLSKRIKDNMYEIVIEGREVKDEDYVERCNLLNEIVISLNTQPDDEHIMFYRETLFRRTDDKDALFKLNDYQIDALERSIQNRIFDDYVVVMSTLEEVTDEMFEEDFLPQFIEDGKHISESINVILMEAPELLKNDQFRKRIKIIIDNSRKCKRNLNKNSKLFLKEYKRL